jgi:beta-barrel assembly-enhancing protease
MTLIRKTTAGALAKILVFAILTALAAPAPSVAITAGEEEKIAEKFLKIVKKNFEIIDDPFIADYISGTGKKILSAFPKKEFDYHFYVIKKDSYNAFAMPAGHIFINSGLIAGMENENELAGILSHEIAHVQLRHISQSIERGSKVSLLTAAGLLAGIFLGPGMGAAATNALAIGSLAAGHSLMLAHSREHEVQADQIGLKYLLKAGYSGAGLLTILKKMRDRTWFGPDHIPVYLTTHPAVDDRMAYVETQMKRQPVLKTRPDHPDFEKAQTRITALYGGARPALNRFKNDIRKAPQNPMSQYGYGLALAESGQNAQAEVFFLKALEERPFDPDILTDLARVYYLQGDYGQALKALEGALAIQPGHIQGLFFLGRTHMAMKDYIAAIDAVETVATRRPGYQNVLYLLGKIYGKKGEMGKAHYWLGLHHRKKEDWKTTIFHLKRALDGAFGPAKKDEIKKMIATASKKKREREREMEEEKERKR